VPLLVNIAKQQTVELTDQPIVIGRDSTCNVCISDALLSRTHAEIRRMSDGRYNIVDLGSTHGTYIAGERISESTLASGDEIVLGATRLRFYENSAEYTAGEPGNSEAQPPAIDPLESYPDLESVWQTGADYLSNYRQNCEPGRLFHPAPRNASLLPEATPGALLSLNIRFLDRDTNFRVHARVIERQTGGEKPGLLVEFVREERDRQELVLACAKGESIPYFRRRHERVPCRLPIVVHVGEDDKRPATAVDISEGGTRLVPSHGLEKGMRVLLSLSFSENKLFPFQRRRSLVLYARVVSIVTRGLQVSAGVEFLFESSKQRNKLVDEVTSLRSKLSK
jgi:pSer/pThr/pTyr-binding forkhead associated (FHA) protein